MSREMLAAYLYFPHVMTRRWLIEEKYVVFGVRPALLWDEVLLPSKYRVSKEELEHF